MLVRVVVASLDLGAAIDRWSLALTLLTMIALLGTAACSCAWVPGRWMLAAWASAAAAGMFQRWFAARTALDSALFRHWLECHDKAVTATDGTQAKLAAIDFALADSGLRSTPSKPRSLKQRTQGALGLLRRQVALLLFQFVVLLAATLGAALH